MSKRHSFIVAIALTALVAAPAAGQQGKLELVPEIGYTFGGGFDIDGGVYNGVAYPGGKLELDASPSYGATLGFETKRGTYFTLSYVYQGTEIGVNWDGNPPSIGGIDPNAKGDITLHKVLFGGRQEFYKSSEQKLRPYIGGGLGFVVLDPNFVTDNGYRPSSQTDFMMSLNGGLRYMFGEEKRFGLQGDFKGTWFWVPSGDVFLWCDIWWGCSAVQGSRTIAQGTASIGAVIKF
jgi:hypothetical protein